MTTISEGQLIGNYRIVRLLGKGGMGAVYEATNETIGRRVAFKVLHPERAQDHERVRRFFQEARATNRIEHPGIVQVSDCERAPDGTAYLVMEFLRGESLGALLRRLRDAGKLPSLQQALQIAAQTADALSAAHEKGIVHRDLKPENLMLVRERFLPGGVRVKVVDFGLAKVTQDVTALQHGTDPEPMGTFLYMSPEQCTDAGDVDAKTDVYALGVTLFEMLAGRPPFVAAAAAAILVKHLREEPPPLRSMAPNVPAPVASLVHRMLAKKRTERPTMLAVARELEKLLAEQSVDLPPPRRLSLWLTGACLAGAALVLATVGLHRILLRPAAPRAPLSCPPLVCPQPPKSPVGPAPSGDAPSPAKASPRVRWRVRSEPSGAALVDEQERPLGVTPFEDSWQARQGTATLRLRLAGYHDEVRRLRLDHDEDELIRLTAKETPESTAGKTPSLAPKKLKPL